MFNSILISVNGYLYLDKQQCDVLNCLKEQIKSIEKNPDKSF